MAPFLKRVFNIFQVNVPFSIHHENRKSQFSMISTAMREKYPYLELFWSLFSRIWTEHREILCTFPYSVRMRENKDQNIFEYRHFLRCVQQVWKEKIGWK